MTARALRLRDAVIGDADDVLAWRNDPVTRTNSFDARQVSEEDHVRWYTAVVHDASQLAVIGEVDGSKVGFVRIAPRSHGTAVISVNVAPAWRGEGIGRALICAAVEAWFERSSFPIDAEIKHTNLASVNAFRSTGFSEHRRLPEHVVLRRSP